MKPVASGKIAARTPRRKPTLKPANDPQRMAANIERIAAGLVARLYQDEHWLRGELTRPQRRIVSNVVTLFATTADSDGNTPVNADNIHERLDLKKQRRGEAVDMVALTCDLLFEMDYLTTAGYRVDLRHQQRERTITEIPAEGGDGVTMRTTAPRTARAFRDWRLTPEFLRELKR